MQATMTRLGSRLPFQEAVQELFYSTHTQVSEATLRRITYHGGRAAEAVSRQEVEMLEREAPESSAWPQQVLLSADGTYIRLTDGDWREVKSVAVGEFETVWHQGTWTSKVKTRNLSYFSRSYAVRDFERYALGELHRRGLEKAKSVVAVNDGAPWIQSFIDYHCPEAVRIIDFAHTTGYLAKAGQAIWGEGTESFKQWMTAACHQLKHRPPQETVANLRLLQPKAKRDEQSTAVDSALFYIQSRVQMMDYAHFRRCGYPIGSGSVESGHKVVTQRRLKGAGMRWAAHNVDPLLALRDLHGNDRWQEGWQHIVLHRQQQQLTKRLERAQAKHLPPPPPITFASLQAAGLLPDDKDDTDSGPSTSKPWRPPPDHPWRNDKWPTKESWRWN